MGEFSTSGNISGVSSNAVYRVSATDTLGDFVDYDLYDNRNLQTEANNFIDLSENNPFGSP